MNAKRLFGVAAVAALLFSACQTNDDTPLVQDEPETTLADEGPGEHLTYRAGEIAWQDGPGSLEPGSQFALLEGDLAEPGVFTLRLRFPDGFEIQPHSHPGVERVTVLSGVFNLGSGDEFDRDAVERLEAGSYTSMPPGTTHFVFTEGETEVQLTSVGPWEIDYVDPDDDPRLRS